MPLTEEQGKLFDQLHKEFREGDDIDQSLREIKNKEDFLSIFSTLYKKNGDTILESCESFKVEQLQAVLNRAKELDIPFEEFIDLPVFLLSFDSKSKKIETISLFKFIEKDDFAILGRVLPAINESYGLESLKRVMPVENRARIKTKLDKDEHKDVLDEINRIEEIMMEEKQMSDLFIKLHEKFRKVDDIDQSLREIENKEDFLCVFSTLYVENGDTILGSYKSLKVKQVQAVLNRAKELDIPFGRVVDLPVFLLSFDSESKKIETISLYKCLFKNDFEFLPDVLDAIDKNYGLELLWRGIPVENRARIKTKLDKDEHKDVLDEINTTKSQGVQNDNTAEEVQSGTSSLASDESTINSESNSATDTVPQSDPIKPMCKATLDMGNKSESSSPTSKAIVVGGIGGTIAALAVVGGLFAAGSALPILALIGIAVAAALVTGLIAGGITYEMSKPNNELNGVDTQQRVSQESGIAA